MGVSDFILLAEKYGIWAAILIVVLFLIGTGIKNGWFTSLFYKISEKWVEKFMKDKTKGINSHIELISESDIINHDVFNYVDIWSTSKIPTMKFSTEYRTAVFRKYLTIYLRVYKRKLQEFINSGDYKSMDDAKLWHSFLSLINETVVAYEKEMIDYGIPVVIIEKMKIKNAEVVNLTIDLIAGICNSQFYNSTDNLLKVFSLLNISLSVLENVVTNSESVCDSINGQLKGLTFEGKTEP